MAGGLNNSPASSTVTANILMSTLSCILILRHGFIITQTNGQEGLSRLRFMTWIKNLPFEPNLPPARMDQLVTGSKQVIDRIQSAKDAALLYHPWKPHPKQ
jgi:hypothetical protein